MYSHQRRQPATKSYLRIHHFVGSEQKLCENQADAWTVPIKAVDRVSDGLHSHPTHRRSQRKRRDKPEHQLATMVHSEGVNA